MRKSSLIPALLILPMLFILVGISFNRTQYANDPDYIYLVNALNLIKGQPVGHVDNPGTTVMEASAVILSVSSLFDGKQDQSLAETVVRDPDRSIQLIRVTFIVLIALLLLLLGWVAWKKTGSLWYALILQITPFLSANVLEHVWTKVSPEPVLFMVSTLLVIVLLLLGTFGLVRSMNTQLKKLPESFDPEDPAADQAADDGTVGEDDIAQG